MKVLIIGGCGLVGREISLALAKSAVLHGQEITGLVLAEKIASEPLDSYFLIETLACDITNRVSVDALIVADADMLKD